MKAWLARLRHDLVRPFVWRARDLQEDGSGPDAAETRRLLGAVLEELYDGEGQPITALALWEAIAADAPATLDTDARNAFARALAHAVDVVSRVATRPTHEVTDAYDAIAALEHAFFRLGAG